MSGKCRWRGHGRAVRGVRHFQTALSVSSRVQGCIHLGRTSLRAYLRVIWDFWEGDALHSKTHLFVSMSSQAGSGTGSGTGYGYD